MKRTLLITMLSAALTAGAGVTLNNFNDVNSDNAVDVGDVNTVLGNILGGSKQYFIDTNGDGNVDVGDVNTVLNTILTTPTVTGDEADAAALLLRCYANFSVSGDGGRDGGCWVPNFDGGTSAFYRQMWNLNELTSDEAMCAWNDFGIEDLNLNISTPSTPQLAGYWLRLYKGIDFCNEYLAKYSELDATATAEVRLLRALNYQMLLDAWGNVPVTVTPGETTPPQKSRAEVFAWVESELLATLDNLDEPSSKTSRSANYGRVDRAAAWLLLARLYLNAEVYTGTARWKDAATYARLVINSPYELVTGRSNHEVNGQNWNFSAYQRLFMGDNDRTDAARECLMPLIHDSRKTFWTSWSTSMYLIAGTFDSDMDEHPWHYTNNGLYYQCWAGLRARPQLVRQFFAEGDYADNEIPSARGYENAVTAGDDRALLNSKDRTLYNTDWQNFHNGFAVAKFTNFTTDGSLSSNAQIADADVFLLRKAEAYLTLAEALTRQDGGSVTPAEAADAINALRTRAGATLMRSYSLDGILDEWSREFYFEGRRRMDLIRFGRYGGETDYNWQWKGGTFEGKDIPAALNLFPIPAMAMEQNPNLTQNPGYDYQVPETFELRLETGAADVISLQSEPFFAFEWDSPDYGNPVVTPTYRIEMDTDGEFPQPISLNQNSNINGTDFVVNPQEINLMLSHRLSSMDIVTVHFRCVATYDGTQVISNSVVRNVKPYNALAPQQWYIIGSDIGDRQWDNNPEAIGTSLAPLYPVDVAFESSYSNTIVTTLTYTSLMTAGDMFKFINKPGSWDDANQISYYAWQELCGGIKQEDFDNRQFRATVTGIYTITMECSTNGSQHITFTRLDTTPQSFSTIALAGDFNTWSTSATPLKPLRGHDNHDWWATVTLDADTNVKFTANDAWDINWGGATFPFGTGIQDGNNIPVAAGTYTVFFNDITGRYVFLSSTGNPTSRKFYITAAEDIDFNAPTAGGYRLYVPHYYNGATPAASKVLLKSNGLTDEVTADKDGWVNSSDFKQALDNLGLTDHTDNDFTLDFTLPDNANLAGSVRVVHNDLSGRQYTVGGKAMEQIEGTDSYKIDLAQGDRWLITDDNGIQYGLPQGTVTDNRKGDLTTLTPIADTLPEALTLIFDPWMMTFKLEEANKYDFPYIFIAGNHNGWGSPADPMYRTGATNGKYVGYAYLDGYYTFRSDEFSWEGITFGSDGTANGLKELGDSFTAEAGFYRVNVDLGNMLYNVASITSVSIIGTANGDTDLDMTFNKSTGAWECSAELTAGEFKFRANHDWEMNWGGTTGDIVTNGPQLTITEAGAYHISLSLKCDTRSTCTITKQ